MSNIYFKDEPKVPTNQIEAGSFVRVPESTSWKECDWGIVCTINNGMNRVWTIVDLASGDNYGCWDSKEIMIIRLHPQLITKPFVIEPDDTEEDDD